MSESRLAYGCTNVHPGQPCQGHDVTCGLPPVQSSYEGPPILHMTIHRSTWLVFFWLIMAIECGVIMNPCPLGNFIHSVLGSKLEMGDIVAMLGDAMSISFVLGAVGGLIVAKLGPRFTSVLGHRLTLSAWGIIGGISLYIALSVNGAEAVDNLLTDQELRWIKGLIHLSACFLGFGVQCVIMSHLWVGALFVHSSAAALMILGSGVDMSASMCQWLCNLSTTVSPNIVYTIYVSILVVIAWLDRETQPNDVSVIKTVVASHQARLASQSPWSSPSGNTATPMTSDFDPSEPSPQTPPPPVNLPGATTTSSRLGRPDRLLSTHQVETILLERHEEYSLWAALKSPYTLGFALFFVLCLWRSKKYFAMNVHLIIGALGRAYHPHDQEKAFDWSTVALSRFNLISGLAAVPAFFMGVITDRFGAISSLIIVNTFGCLMVLPITILDSLEGNKTFISVLLATSCLSYMVSSGFLFGMVTAFNIKLFGFKQISPLQGLYVSLAGLVSFTSDLGCKLLYYNTGQTIIDATANDFKFLLINLAGFAIPACLYMYGWRTTKSDRMLLEEEFSETIAMRTESSSQFWVPFLSAVLIHPPDDSAFRKVSWVALENQFHGSQIVQTTPHPSDVFESSPIQKRLHNQPGAKSPVEKFLDHVVDKYQKFASPKHSKSVKLGGHGDHLREPLIKKQEVFKVEKWMDTIVDAVQDFEFSNPPRHNHENVHVINKTP